MADAATLQNRLDEIDAILSRGVSSATIDGLRTDYNLDALAKERARIEQRLAAVRGGSNFRRVVMRNG
jgi:hypothetical protein